MITDALENLPQYSGIVKNLEKGLAYLSGKDKLPEGKYEFDGGFILATQVASVPLAEKRFEDHKKYADVMVIVEGVETVSFCPTSKLTVAVEYDAAADVSFYAGEGKDCLLTLPAGMVYIVMPGEGHKPCIHTEKPTNCYKYIIKCAQN